MHFLFYNKYLILAYIIERIISIKKFPSKDFSEKIFIPFQLLLKYSFLYFIFFSITLCLFNGFLKLIINLTI